MGLASRAPLTVLDEPYLGLDGIAREAFYSALRKDLEEQPRTVILSTHLVDEMADLLDRVIVIDRGQIVADASVSDLRGRYTAVAGPTSRLAGLRSTETIVGERVVGAMTQVVVDHLSDEQSSTLRGDGVEVAPASLQDIVFRFLIDDAGRDAA